MSDFIGFGRGDKEVLNNGRLERYKGKENQTDRIALIWFYKNPETGEYELGDDATPKFAKSRCHYAPGLGYIKPQGEYTTQKFGAPKIRLGTYVLKYRTDRSGKPQPPLEYEIMEWQFGSSKFEELASINEEFPLTKHDLKVNCNGEQYQKLTFTACSGEALWRRDPDMRAAVLKAVADHGDINLAREVSIDEIKAAMGQPVEVVSSDDDDLDFDGLMSTLG